MDNKNVGKRKNTMTKTLINNISIVEVEKIWTRLGMYKGAEELSNLLNEYISSSTLRYISQKFGWRRSVHPNSPILVGVKRGTVPASYYKHLIFPEVNKNEENIFPQITNN